MNLKVTMNTSLNHALEKDVRHSKGVLLEELRDTSEEIREIEHTLGKLRESKWDLVRRLRDMGHAFTASTEGMDVVLSAPPSFKFIKDAKC